MTNTDAAKLLHSFVCMSEFCDGTGHLASYSADARKMTTATGRQRAIAMHAVLCDADLDQYISEYRGGCPERERHIDACADVLAVRGWL